MARVRTSFLTASGIVAASHAGLVSMHVGMDGTNDPSITIHKGQDSSGEEVVPTNSYDADKLGLNGFESYHIKDCPGGIYVAITCAGDCEVVVGWLPV